MKPNASNYPDAKCCYGYMTVCVLCLGSQPRHVDTTTVVTGFPVVQCELCKRKVKAS